MTLLEAINARHSVRAYKPLPLSDDAIIALQEKIADINSSANLHIQLVVNEPKSFACAMAKYGKFSGVCNYLVMAGKKSDDLDYRIGYYGEQLVLLAQQLGLNTCWAGLTFSKIPGTFTLDKEEKIACYIALGYGETQGNTHKIKTPSDVSNISAITPGWFSRGIDAALKAPTAVNQQKFYFEYKSPSGDGKATVSAKRSWSMVGFTQMDLGIVKLHFEIGAGKENFIWK